MAHSITVLLIEDSSTQARLVAGQLSQYNIDILIAEDGLQGLQYVDIFRPDLIILDVNLPKLDGYQVCHRLKRDDKTRHIPVIMLTANDSSEDARRGREVGADDYIPKDMFAIRHLIKALEANGLVETSAEV